MLLLSLSFALPKTMVRWIATPTLLCRFVASSMALRRPSYLSFSTFVSAGVTLFAKFRICPIFSFPSSLCVIAVVDRKIFTQAATGYRYDGEIPLRDAVTPCCASPYPEGIR